MYSRFAQKMCVSLHGLYPIIYTSEIHLILIYTQLVHLKCVRFGLWINYSNVQIRMDFGLPGPCLPSHLALQSGYLWSRRRTHLAVWSLHSYSSPRSVKPVGLSSFGPLLSTWQSLVGPVPVVRDPTPTVSIPMISTPKKTTKIFKWMTLAMLRKGMLRALATDAAWNDTGTRRVVYQNI